MLNTMCDIVLSPLLQLLSVALEMHGFHLLRWLVPSTFADSNIKH